MGAEGAIYSCNIYEHNFFIRCFVYIHILIQKVMATVNMQIIAITSHGSDMN